MKVLSIRTLCMFYRDGIRYEGEYRKSMRHGYGECMFDDGSCYRGYWRDNLQHGEGVLIREDGEEIPGTWKNGLLRSGQSP